LLVWVKSGQVVQPDRVLADTKRAASYRTELTLAAIVLWLRDSPDTA
jgi:hypothetical protein